MSETTEPTPDAEAEAPPPADATAIETQADTPATEPQEPEPESSKPTRGDRRFANLTARYAAVAAERDEERRQRLAAEALARASQPDAPPPASESPEQIARRMVAEQRYNEKRASVVAAGNKEFGVADWTAKTEVLAAMGATDNADFMEALVDLPNAPAVVAHLSDDTDALVVLMQKPPRAMAAEMGRMSAKLEIPATPAAKPLSAAPRPPAAVTAPVVIPEPSLEDLAKGDDMAAYKAALMKSSPEMRRMLGGR